MFQSGDKIRLSLLKVFCRFGHVVKKVCRATRILRSRGTMPFSQLHILVRSSNKYMYFHDKGHLDWVPGKVRPLCTLKMVHFTSLCLATLPSTSMKHPISDEDGCFCTPQSVQHFPSYHQFLSSATILLISMSVTSNDDVSHDKKRSGDNIQKDVSQYYSVQLAYAYAKLIYPHQLPPYLSFRPRTF